MKKYIGVIILILVVIFAAFYIYNRDKKNIPEQNITIDSSSR